MRVLNRTHRLCPSASCRRRERAFLPGPRGSGSRSWSSPTSPTSPADPAQRRPSRPSRQTWRRIGRTPFLTLCERACNETHVGPKSPRSGPKTQHYANVIRVRTVALLRAQQARSLRTCVWSPGIALANFLQYCNLPIFFPEPNTTWLGWLPQPSLGCRSPRCTM